MGGAVGLILCLATATSINTINTDCVDCLEFEGELQTLALGISNASWIRPIPFEKEYLKLRNVKFAETLALINSISVLVKRFLRMFSIFNDLAFSFLSGEIFAMQLCPNLLLVVPIRSY